MSIVAASVLGLTALGVPSTGRIPAGLPTLEGPALRLRDVEGIVPLARRMPVTCLYRKRLRRPRLRRKARIYPRPPAGASRHRSSKSRDRAGARLSRRRWAVAIGCERQGGRPQPARACVRLSDARAVSALPHRVVGKPAEGRTGCGGPDRSVRLVRCSHALPHVASEPVGLFRRGNRPWCRTPSGDSAGGSARRIGFHFDPAGPCIAPTRRIARPHPREQVFRPHPGTPKTRPCPVSSPSGPKPH